MQKRATRGTRVFDGGGWRMDITTQERIVSGIYGDLFNAYSGKLFDESVQLFFDRHRRWGKDWGWFKGKVCLDAGCGGGRYVVALAKLEAKRVYGVDISERAVEVARKRCGERGLVNTDIQVGSVLRLPFPDETFDYVVSSGVIHHTPDPRKAFKELVRVLKRGGTIFLSVYGRGGLKWLVNDFFRFTICKIIPFHFTERAFSFFGIPANKRYNILDNLYVPHCYRFTEAEIQNWLTDAGFKNSERVKFERYDYGHPLSRLIHGEGWIQMYADKK